MIAMRKRLELKSDEGVSLVEVLVAMMVFTMIALGVGASLLILVRMTEDTRSRLVASNLATTEIDYVRGFDDPFAVVNKTTDRTVSGKKYTVARSTSWVEISGADVACGSGGGIMRSKRVNVTVTWAGMLSTTKPVRSDTLISPDDRINDPSLGTIRVSALTAAGTGSAGVTVAVSPALATAPPATDADGCSYALKVKPGTYTVTLSRAGSVDSAQNASPSKTLEVTAGGSVAAQFQFDYSATFALRYASNYSGAAPRLPENLNTSFLSTYGLYVQSGRQSQATLHPFTGGYAVIAGKYAAPIPGNNGCVSVDPAAWPAATVGGVALAAGLRNPNVGAAAGGQASMDIPMGVVSVKTTAERYVFAVPATPPAAANAPSCAVNTTYSFGKLAAGTQVLALPFGTWTFTTSTSSNGSSPSTVAQTDISVLSNTAPQISGSNVTTLDPRSRK
jgi:Tfp pilus assembly protein PilV